MVSFRFNQTKGTRRRIGVFIFVETKAKVKTVSVTHFEQSGYKFSPVSGWCCDLNTIPRKNHPCFPTIWSKEGFFRGIVLIISMIYF